MSVPLTLYNPRDVEPALLVDLMAGRVALLEDILGDLRRKGEGQARRRHWLLRGRRGIGKTHFAGVLYHRVRADPTLKRTYLPLWLGEAEVYEVYSVGKLLEKIGERLAEEVGEPSIVGRMRTIEGTGDDEAYFQSLVALLTQEAKERHRVLLVLLENLDALLDSFAPKEREAETRALRSLLLNVPHLSFVCTTPVRQLKGLDDDALEGHLQERDLAPLSEEEVGQLYRKLAALTGRRDIEEVLFSSPEGPARLRVIHRLTGGLPRSVKMVFSVMQGRGSLRSLVDELRTMLDAQTAYFEARLGQLAPREQAIVTAMALSPMNLTLKEIAQASRLPERTLSTLVARLEEDGHVLPVAGTGGRGTVYELSEGLFRLWYQYRKGRLLLEPLVEFLANWYPLRELERHVVEMREGLSGEAPLLQRGAEVALRQAEEALRRATAGQHKEPRWWEYGKSLVADLEECPLSAPIPVRSFVEVFAAVGRGEVEEGKRTLGALLSRPEAQDARSMVALAEAMDHLPRLVGPNPGPATSILEMLIARLGERRTPGARDVVALAHLALATLLNSDERYDEALVHCEQASSALDDISTSPPILTLRGEIFTGLEQYDDAQRALERALELQVRSPDAWSEGLLLDTLLNLAEVYRQNDNQAAIHKVTAQVQEYFGNHEDVALRERAAAGLLALRGQLDNVRQPAELLNRLDPFLRDLEAADGTELQELLSRFELAKVLLVAEMGQRPRAMEAMERWVHARKDGRLRDVGSLQEVIVALFRVFGTEALSRWLEVLLSATVEPNAKALLGMYRLLAQVLRAELEEGDDAQACAARRRQELARIPQELRGRIEELAEQIHPLFEEEDDSALA